MFSTAYDLSTLSFLILFIAKISPSSLLAKNTLPKAPSPITLRRVKLSRVMSVMMHLLLFRVRSSSAPSNSGSVSLLSSLESSPVFSDLLSSLSPINLEGLQTSSIWWQFSPESLVELLEPFCMSQSQFLSGSLLSST